MAITQRPIRPIRIDFECDECGKGNYRFGGIVLTSYPPQYPHICNSCGNKKTFKVKFPYIKYTDEGSLLDLDDLNA